MESTLQGRVALVTGANSGVGLELTRQLLAQGAEVAALVRSEFPADDELARAREGGRLRVYRADFADWASLRQGLDAVKRGESKLDLLFNNAGVAFPDLRRVATDLDGHFALNTVVPFIILEELGDLLEAGTLKTVVQTSSNALLYVRDFSLGTLQNPVRYTPLFGPYGASKLALSLWTHEAAAAWQARGITLVSACPGGTKTKMTAEPQLWFMKLLFPLISHPAPEGARRILQASGGKPGAFVVGPKSRATHVPFGELGPGVLELVRGVYEKEYLPSIPASLQAQR